MIRIPRNLRISEQRLMRLNLLTMLYLLVIHMHANAQSTISVVNNQVASNPKIDPLVYTTVEHYEIRGDSFDDLRRELNGKGHGGDGTTTGIVTYRFNSEKSDGQCEIRSVRAQCNAKVRLPRWHDMSKVPLPMQEYWTQVYNKLKKHEMGHVDICADIARAVEKALWSTPANQHCYFVDDIARKRADAAVAGMNARQLAYDEREYGVISKRLKAELKRSGSN